MSNTTSLAHAAAKRSLAWAVSGVKSAEEAFDRGDFSEANRILDSVFRNSTFSEQITALLESIPKREKE